MTATPTRDSFRLDVNALRALAVLAVIAFHFELPGARAGYLGVDVFFVISGFLIGGQITNQLDQGRFRLAHFFAGRIRRIVPALALTCVAVLAWGWWFQLPADYKALARSATSAVEFVSNRHFERQLGYFDLGAAYKPLLHTWSLSVEAQFYLVLPFLLIAAWQLPRHWRGLALVAATALSFAYALRLGQQHPAQAFYSFPARAWEFLIGGLAAQVPAATIAPLPRIALWRTPLLVAAWLALGACSFLLPAGIVWPGPWTLVPTTLTVLIILLGTGRAPGPVARHALVQHLGTISYSLYLWHWPLLVCWRLTFLVAAITPLDWAWLLVATWIAGWLSWRYAEQPLRTRPAWGAPRRLYAGWVGLLVLFVSFGAVVSRTDGLGWRLPAYTVGAQAASTPHQRMDQCWHLPGAAPDEQKQACAIGPSQAPSPSFAVWGDSHALHLMGALRARAEASHLTGRLFHSAGCEPSLAPGAPAGPACERHNQEVAAWLDATPSVRTVVFSIRQNDPYRVDRAWAQASQLASRGVRVVFLGPLPEAHRPVVQEWAAEQLLQRAAVPEKTIDRDAPTRVASFDVRLAHWRQQAALATGQHGALIVPIDLTSLFCDARRCWLVREGEAYFSDADHLTRAAAAKVVDLLLPQLGAGETPSVRQAAR